MEFRIVDEQTGDVLLSRPMEAMPAIVSSNLALVVESELTSIKERFERLSRLKKVLAPTTVPASPDGDS